MPSVSHCLSRFLAKLELQWFEVTWCCRCVESLATAYQPTVLTAFQDRTDIGHQMAFQDDPGWQMISDEKRWICQMGQRQRDIKCSAIFFFSPSGLLPQVSGCQPPDQFPFMSKLYASKWATQILDCLKKIVFAEKYAAWSNHTIKKLIRKAFTRVFDYVIKQVCCLEHQGTDNLVYCCWIHFLQIRSW